MATIVSLCALTVSFYQVQIERKHQLASVWPNVSISASLRLDKDSAQNSCGLLVKNRGIGPAVIEEINISYKGQNCTDENKLMEHVFGKTLGLTGDYGIDQLWIGRVIAPNENIIWIKVGGTENTLKFRDAVYSEDVKIKIRYASVYEEKWEANYNTGEPKVVKLN